MIEPDPFHEVLEIAGGYSLSRCLHVVADLGVADALDEGPRSVADLAASVGAHPEALGRVLRLLSAHGVFELRGDSCRHSPASRLLRTDDSRSMRSLVRMFGLPMNWAVYGELGHAVRTGLPAAEKVLPGGFWSRFADHPDEAGIFNAAMAAKAHGQVAAVTAAYDFKGFGVVGDIGGGRGHLLEAVLESAPAAKGVLFDLPHVVADAADVASDRLSLQGGDFFKDPLPVCDAYLVMEVIHDWGDEEAVAILKAVSRAAPSHGRLLLIEQIVPDDPGPHWSKSLDIHMLALLGGKQRTRREYEALLDRSSFSFEREIDTGADISILEAVPV
ncbi:MAG: methyltransferase [Gemmatimonadota bacterium]